MSVQQDIPRSPTTGEPVTVVERRNRLGIWLCIVSDATGTVALLVAYAYLWSLNVGGGWAPPKDAFADPVPFWVIVVGTVLVALLMWWGVKGMKAGNRGRLVAAAGLAVLVAIATFIVQIVQLSTFPFGPSDGAYASATLWLCIGAAFHLAMDTLLVLAILGRTRAGLITPANPFHAHLVAMYTTWVAIAIFLGALFATTMTTSPNTSSPPFGDFTKAPAAAASAAAAVSSAISSAAPAPSGSAAPAASASASPAASSGS